MCYPDAGALELSHVDASFSWCACTLLPLALCLAGCGAFDPCGNDILARVASPSATRDVVVFQRDCGGTTGFSTQVSILPHGASFRDHATLWSSAEGGNVLVVDDDRGAAPPGPGGGPDVGVMWQDDRHLRLTYHPRVRVFKAETDLAGVAVQHVRSVQAR